MLPGYLIERNNYPGFVVAKHRKKEVAVPKAFVPKFWDELDGRCIVAKEIRRRYEELASDTGADSVQKQMLVQRAVFINLRLEAIECEAAQGEPFDAGLYASMTNSLNGLLSKLGLNKQIKNADDLQSYLEGGR